MISYSENLKLIIFFFQGHVIKISSDNISTFSEIAHSIKFEPLIKVSTTFNNIQIQYNKIQELIKIESLLSKIDENNLEKIKFQIIQSFLTKELKYHKLLIDILIYYAKIRPLKIDFYIQLIESLVHNNSNIRKTALSSQSPDKKLTKTINKKIIIKPQIKSHTQVRPRLSSTLQITSKKSEIKDTNQISDIIIEEIKNPLIYDFISYYFLYRLFINSVITTKKQKLAILNFVKESNSEDLKEWFSSTLKTLSKGQQELYNQYTTYLNEEPIRLSIRNDNISEIQSLLNSKNKFNINYNDKNVLSDKIVFDLISPKNKKAIYLTEYSAIFGSINSFKYFVSKNFKMPKNILKKAVKGGEFEIIDLCIEKGFQMKETNTFLNASIKYHRNKVFKWLINLNQGQFIKNPLISIQSYNFKIFLKTEFANFNFAFDLIKFNNILLIELISPYLHNFFKLILAFYSIVSNSNEIATFLYEAIDDIRYPLNYLSQLKFYSNELDRFNSIIKHSKSDKFEKEVVFVLFCFVNDNVDFLTVLFSVFKLKSSAAFKALCRGGFLFNSFKLTKCQKFIFSILSDFISEEKVVSLLRGSEEDSKLLFLLFEQFNSLHLKFTKSQLNSIVSQLLRKKDCRSIFLKNHSNFVSIECLLKLIEDTDGFDIFYELCTFENIDINFLLKMYLNRITIKYQTKIESSLPTSRRVTTSFSEREDAKKFISLCTSHSLFDALYEVDDDGNSYLHLIATRNIDYALRFVLANPLFKQTLNKCNKFNKTPLVAAIECKSVECIQILIDQSGINFSICDRFEMNALNYAVQCDSLDLVSKIVGLCSDQKNIKKAKNEKSTSFDVVNFVSKNRHISPICCSRSIEMVNLLLSHGAKPTTFNCVDNEGQTLLVKSLNSSSLDYRFLLSNLKGIDINRKSEDGKTFIMKSIEMNQYDSIIEYLDQNAIQKVDKNPSQKVGKTSSQKVDNKQIIESSTPTLHSVDYSVKSKENSYLASAIKANNFDLIDRFSPASIKEGNDQAGLIESMKQKGVFYSKLTSKLISSFKARIELTPRQAVEYLPAVTDATCFDFLLRQSKDPRKPFNSLYNDRTVLISSIVMNNTNLFNFLMANKDSIDLNLNWSNSSGLNCFDFSVEKQSKEMTEALFREASLLKSTESFEKVIIKKSKFSCSLRLEEDIRSKWIFDVLKKRKDHLFLQIIENNCVDLFDMVVDEIDSESLINEALRIALNKRFDHILNGLLNNRFVDNELALKLAIEQNNAALFKALVLKLNQSVNLNKFVELVLGANQNIKSVYASYANVSDFTKKMLDNECDLSLGVNDVIALLDLAK